MIKMQWELDIQILHYNNEPTLSSEYKEIIVWYNILEEPTAPYTPKQNRGSEHAGALFTEKNSFNVQYSESSNGLLVRIL